MAKMKPSKGANDPDIIPPYRRCESVTEVPEPTCGALTEGCTLEQAFAELTEEATAVLYKLFRTGAFEQLSPAMDRELVRKKQWAGFIAERDGIQGRGNMRYGLTLERSLRIWHKYTVRVLTDEEAKYPNIRRGYEVNGETLAEHSTIWYRSYCERTNAEPDLNEGLRRFRAEQCLLPDLPDAELIEHYRSNPLPIWYANGTVSDQEQVTDRNAHLSNELEYIQPGRLQLPQEQTFTKWLEEFVAEVETCVARFGEDPELPHEIARFVEGLAKYEVCSFEGKPLRELLATQRGARKFLAAMDRQRDRLAAKLSEIADEWPVDVPSSEQGQRLTWKGHTTELAALIDLLETKGWIEGGRSRSLLAQRVAAVFNGHDGEPLEPRTLITYLARSYKPLPRNGVEFTASPNPDKNQ